MNKSRDYELDALWLEEQIRRRTEAQAYRHGFGTGGTAGCSDRYRLLGVEALLERWLKMAPAEWRSADMARALRTPVSRCHESLRAGAERGLVVLRGGKWSRA